MRDSHISPWIAGTTAGFASGGAVWSLMLLLTQYLQSNNELLAWSISLASITVAGLVTGLSQGLYLQRLTGKIPYLGWTGATVVGVIMGLLVIGSIGRGGTGPSLTLNFSVAGAYISMPLAHATGSAYSLEMIVGVSSISILYYGCMAAFMFAAVAGIIPSVLQWFLLRRHFRNSFFWTVFSVLAFDLSGAACVSVSWLAGSFMGGAPVVQDNSAVAALIGLLGWCATGFTIGAATSPVLPWLQSQPLEEGTLF
ncbi:MAG: hypothetical protein M3437_06205 [Chloroflexota bacterium]|nr:hypothetical protein [Chloroflexota bacterium]MDQ5866046.1 hypothetical protein [Chloroflexota bacterium]